MTDEGKGIIIEDSETREPQPKSPGRRRALRVLAGAGLAVAGFAAGRTTAPTPTVETQTAAPTPSKSPENILTTEPSAVSNTGWRVKYPEAKSNVTYQNTPKTTKESEVEYSWNKENDLVSLNIGRDYTGIIIGTRADNDGKRVPSLTVFTDTSTSNYKSQEFLLKEAPDNKNIGENSVDTRVVAFEKPKTGEIRYFQIKVNPQQHLTVAEMIPVTK